jgi:hypothetical protein
VPIYPNCYIKYCAPLQNRDDLMPRLIGKSSEAPLYLGIALMVVIAGAVALEYMGTINVIPGFGKEHKRAGQPLSASNSRTMYVTR